MKHPAGERFAVELVAQAGDVPAVVRLRAALKRFLRDYGLRCRSVEQLPAGTPPPAQDDAGAVEATVGPPADADAS